MKRFISATYLYLFLSGCTPPEYHQVVVSRDVPESPSFVVQPANNYMHEVLFANQIENAIISSGVKVVRRPGAKEVTAEKSIGGVQGDRLQSHDAASTSIRKADAKLTERYFEYDEVNADYLVQTYATEKHVKISNLETREILAVFHAERYFSSDGSTKSLRHKINETLVSMGIPVKVYLY